MGRGKGRKTAAWSAMPLGLYQYAVAVVHLVLDDLGGPAVVELDFRFHLFVLKAEADGTVAQAFARAAKKGEAAFFCLIGAGALHDLGIEHHGADGGGAAVIPKGDDIFANTDHIGGHAHAGFPVGQ